MADGLKHNKTLKHLCLERNVFDAKALEFLAEGLACNSTLEGLRLAGNPDLMRVRDDTMSTCIDMRGLERLAEALNRPPTSECGPSGLRSLNICNLMMLDEDRDVFSALIRGNETLEKLNLSNNGLSGKQGEYIADAIRENITLIKLDLSSNAVGDLGAAKFAEALEKNKVCVRKSYGVWMF